METSIWGTLTPRQALWECSPRRSSLLDACQEPIFQLKGQSLTQGQRLAPGSEPTVSLPPGVKRGGQAWFSSENQGGTRFKGL